MIIAIRMAALTASHNMAVIQRTREQDRSSFSLQTIKQQQCFLRLPGMSGGWRSSPGNTLRIISVAWELRGSLVSALISAKGLIRLLLHGAGRIDGTCWVSTRNRTEF